MTSMPPLNPPLNPVDSVPVAIASLSFIPDSNEALSDELTLLAGHINAAQYRFLKLLAALIERNAWGGDSGIKTPAHWLNYHCGIDLGAARQKVKVAKALAHLPQIDAAFATGSISYSKVRAMTRTATPETEATLLNIGRRSRAVPPSIRRALTIRDGGCRHPGCCQTKYVDAHHIQHWCDGGETSLENLVLLCRYHHRALHEGVFSIEKDCTGESTLRFMNRNGREIKPALYPQFAAPSIGDSGETELELDNEQRGLEIDARTAVTCWQGERLDYGMVIDALMRGS